MFRRMFIGLALALLVALPAAAQDFHKGAGAYNRGDYATALREWHPLADKGNLRAQYNLGVMYETGKGVQKNYAEAVKWYRKAAEQGNVNARNNLGYMYDRGLGVRQNHAEALKWYRKAAEQGDATAQFNVGNMYSRGLGVPQNDAEAVKWYRKAAKQGDADAQKSLRFMQKSGRVAAAKGAKGKPGAAAKKGKPGAAAKKEKPRRVAKAGKPRTAAKKVTPRTAAKKEKPRRVAKKEKPRRVVKKAPPAPTRGGYHVQLSSIKSEALAMKEAGRLTRVHKPVLGNLEVAPVRADLGPRGVFYRLRAGPLSDRVAAGSLCRKLSARNQGCLVVKQ